MLWSVVIILTFAMSSACAQATTVEGSECALCESPILETGTSAVERYADGRPLTLHSRRQKILVEG